MAEAALRVNCLLASQSPGASAHRQRLVKSIVTGFLRSNKDLGHFVGLVGLAHLLVSRDTAVFFLGFDGLDTLLGLLEALRRDCACVYYALLCVWSLSFHAEARPGFAASSDRLVQTLRAALETFREAKIARVVCKLLQNLFPFPRLQSAFEAQPGLLRELRLLARRKPQDQGLARLLAAVCADLGALQKSRAFRGSPGADWSKGKAALTSRLSRAKSPRACSAAAPSTRRSSSSGLRGNWS